MLFHFYVTFFSFSILDYEAFEIMKWKDYSKHNHKQYAFLYKDNVEKLQQRKADCTMLFVDRRFPIDVIFYASV